MSLKRFAANSMHCLRIGLTSLALFQFSLGGPLASTAQAQTDNDAKTTTPIKHVIVIIGENRSFDHVFATYNPGNGHKGLEPALGRHRQGRRHSRSQL